jgi:hypothetical protein
VDMQIKYKSYSEKALTDESRMLRTIFQVNHHGAEGLLEKSYGEMVKQMGKSYIR